MKLFKKFENQLFTSGSAISKVLFYNPADLIFYLLPVRGKFKYNEINRKKLLSLMTRYYFNVNISVDFQEIIKTGVKMVQINEEVINKENFERSPIRKVIELWFNLGLKKG